MGSVVDCDELDEDLLSEGFDVDESDQLIFGHFLDAFGEIRHKADQQGMRGESLFDLVGNGFAGEYRLSQNVLCSWLLDHK